MLGTANYIIKKAGNEFNSKVINYAVASQLSFDKPTLFIAGGNNTNNLERAAGYVFLFDNLLEEFSKDTNIVSVNYNNGNTRTFDHANTLDLVNFPFKSLISKNGERLDLETALKKMRNITIVTHCRGEDFVDILIKNLSNKILELGYTEEEKNLIIGQIMVVTFGEISRDNPAMHFNIISPKDELLLASRETYWKKLTSDEKIIDSVQISNEDRSIFRKILNTRNAKMRNLANRLMVQFFTKNERCIVMLEGNTLSLAVSPLSKEEDLDTNPEHKLSNLRRDESNYLLSRETATIAGDYASKSLLIVVVNSIANAMLNCRQKGFTPLSLEELKLQIEEVVKKLNSSPTVELEYLDFGEFGKY